LRKFLLEHFTEPGSELETCEPSDWHHEPIKLIRINDVDLRNWAMRLNEMWLQLCRKVSKHDLIALSVVYHDLSLISVVYVIYH
uniref:Alpha,alpha-trehalose glucohydrolase n=1 Tax=Anisakis simplex TaxID=6269 RepID=A0A0M3JEW1_ANISI